MRIFYTMSDGSRTERILSISEAEKIRHLSPPDAMMVLIEDAKTHGKPVPSGLDMNPVKRPGKRKQKVLCGLASDVTAQIEDLKRQGWELIPESVKSFPMDIWTMTSGDNHGIIQIQVPVPHMHMQAIMEREPYYHEWEVVHE